MPCYFKIANKHLFCQLNNTHMFFSIVKFYQRIKVKEFQGIKKYSMKEKKIKTIDNQNLTK